MPGRLNNGAEPGHGGARPGAGRKPEWFGVQCREIFEKHEILGFIAGVAVGAEKKAMIRDRLRAAEMLKDWGYGKVTKPIEIEGSMSRLVIVRPGETEHLKVKNRDATPVVP